MTLARIHLFAATPLKGGLLAALLFLQAGNPAGAVTGVVRLPGGASAAGVRVYAQQVRDATDPSVPSAPLEGLSQTDTAGRYRIELAPGRYYIASGSVSSPTYYPGTTDLSAARVITVVSGGVVEGIDFGNFVAPSSRTPGVPIQAGVAGSVRFPDGTPAAGVRVGVFSSTVPPLPGTPLPNSANGRIATTDATGSYRILGILPGSYYVAAGFLEAPAFYTTTSTTAAAPIVVATTTVDSINIVMPPPPSRVGMTVRGSVRSKDGIPAPGSTVRVVNPELAGKLLPSIGALPDVPVSQDGTFEISNVPPGSYVAQAFLGSANEYQLIVVGNAPVVDLRFTLPATFLYGRIVLEDDSPVPDPQLFSAAAISTVDNPNVVRYTIFPFPEVDPSRASMKKANSAFIFGRSRKGTNSGRSPAARRI